MKMWTNTKTLEGFVDDLLFTESPSEADIAVLGSKSIKIKDFPNLKGIFRVGVGSDNIPFEEAKQRNIKVAFPKQKTIEYIFEDKRMGTAGALSLLGDRPQEPFFVMNGDLLTNINFEHVLEFQLSSSVAATMCVREYDFEVPYGVVNILDRYITSIDEKPVHNFFVNAGIYILNSSCMRLIPDDEFYDMPQLFEKLIKLNERVASFPLKGYWMDIGKMHDYERAQQDYEKIFGEI